MKNAQSADQAPNSPSVRTILDQVHQGALSVADAEALLARLNDHQSDLARMPSLDFAVVDDDRRRRCGFPEVIFGQGKTPEQMLAIAQRIAGAGFGCLATRVDPVAAAVLMDAFPGGVSDAIARTFCVAPDVPLARLGRVAVIAAGTSDLPCAREALNTAEAMGCEVECVVDVGVAGLHRILSHVDLLRRQHAIVVVAGMEGALPSVVGGLVACPVIAVPSSVGYGASFQGVAALLGMLSSCAANVAVVNIDAGFCGGYVASLIARQSAPIDSPVDDDSPQEWGHGG